MYKTDITYKDFDGNEFTETFYFNLSKAELLQLELMYPEGYQVYLQRLLDEGNRRGLIAAFNDIITKSYGERSDDGKRFIKSPEISSAFMSSEAFSELFMRMITEEGYANKFISAVLPKDLVGDVQRDNMLKLTGDK